MPWFTVFDISVVRLNDELPTDGHNRKSHHHLHNDMRYTVKKDEPVSKTPAPGQANTVKIDMPKIEQAIGKAEVIRDVTSIEEKPSAETTEAETLPKEAVKPETSIEQDS